MANRALGASKPLTTILSDDEDSEPHKHAFSKGKPFTNDVINILSSSELSMQNHPSTGSKCKQPTKEPAYNTKKLKTGKSAGKMASNRGDGKKRNTGQGRSRSILTDTASEGEGETIKRPHPKLKLTYLKAEHTQGASTSPPAPPPASDAHKAPKDHPHHSCLPLPLPEPSTARQSSPTHVGTARQPDQAPSALTPPQEDLTSRAPAHVDPTSTSMQPQPIPPPLPNTHPVGPGIYPPPLIHPVLMFSLHPSSQVNALECIHIKGCR